MAALPDYQRQFADAVLTGDRDTALTLFQGRLARRRLGLRVYANNAMHALVSALHDTFPAVNAMLGDETFTALAVAYVRANPPVRDALLVWYGEGFPAFLDRVAVEEAPYRAELARLEWAWLEAYHAPEAVPLPPAAFAVLTPEQLIAAHMRLHPSVHLLCCANDIEPIWQRYRGGLDASAGSDQRDRSCRIAVMRPFAEVIVRPLSSPVFDCLALLRDGAPFGEATGHLAEAEHVAELQELLAAGLFADIAANSPGDHRHGHDTDDNHCLGNRPTVGSGRCRQTS